MLKELPREQTQNEHSDEALVYYAKACEPNQNEARIAMLVSGELANVSTNNN